MGAVAAKDPAGLPSAERNQPGLFILSEDLQAHLVVDLLALLDDDALGQLLSSEADRGSSDLLAVHQNTALHDETAGLTVEAARPALTIRVRMPMEPSVRSAWSAECWAYAQHHRQHR